VFNFSQPFALESGKRAGICWCNKECRSAIDQTVVQRHDWSRTRDVISGRLPYGLWIEFCSFPLKIVHDAKFSSSDWNPPQWDWLQSAVFVVFHSPHHANTTSLTALYGTRSLRSALFWDITQRMVVIPCWRFGRTGWYKLQGSGNSRFLDSWPLKMGPIGYPETSVRNYHHTLRNNQEECKSHLLHGGSLKSRKPKCSLCAH
jgi:hypothetical protein